MDWTSLRFWIPTFLGNALMTILCIYAKDTVGIVVMSFCAGMGVVMIIHNLIRRWVK